jgi:hypothetical protein
MQMKKRWSEMVVAAMVMAVLSVMVFAGPAKSLNRLSAQEAAWWNASHVLEVDYNDFVGVTTATNTTIVITNAVPAGSLVRFQLMKLDQAWDQPTSTDSMLVYSGWAASTAGFLASTEIAADGTEIFAAVTPMTVGLVTTNGGWYYMTTATNILTTFAQSSSGSCISSNTAGKTRLFFRIIPPPSE